MASADAEVYAALDRALRSLRARWYVFGAQAAILHGAARFTEDIDVTVELGDRPHSVLVAALTQHGFSTRTEDESFIEQTRVLPLVHQATNTPVDVVLAGPGIEEMFFEGAIELDIGGLLVPVACAEDMVVMKILSGRAKDLEDVAAMLAARHASFDEQRVRELLGMLEQALDQSDLLPLFERCWGRATQGR
jgi:hypothetical protein